MMQKKVQADTKPKLHRRNLHLNGYDFDSLCKTEPDLAAFVKINEFNHSFFLKQPSQLH